VAQVNDLSRSLTAFDSISTLVVVLAWPENAKRVEPPEHWPLVGAITGPRNGYDVLDVECEGLGWLASNPVEIARMARGIRRVRDEGLDFEELVRQQKARPEVQRWMAQVRATVNASLAQKD
jgi:hypothetical protein